MLDAHAARIEAAIRGCAVVATYALNTVQLSPILFRYDDAPHHPGVATFPHHKHLPTGVTHSPALHFAEVLAEAEAQVLGIP